MSSVLGQEAIVSKLTSLLCYFIKMPYLSKQFCIYQRNPWRNTKWATRINRLANHPGGKNNSRLMTYSIKSARLSASRIPVSRPQFPITYSAFVFSQRVCCKADYTLWPAPPPPPPLSGSSFPGSLCPSLDLSDSPLHIEIPQSPLLSSFGYFNISSLSLQ